MKTVWIALRSVYEIAWRGGFVFVAIALMASLSEGGKDTPAGDLKEDAETAELEPSSQEVTYVTMRKSLDARNSQCCLLDEEGNELLRVSYDGRKYMHLAWAERFSARPSVTTTTDGWMGMNFRANGVLHNLMRQPDGNVRLELSGLPDGNWNEFHITSTGEVVRMHPPLVQ